MLNFRNRYSSFTVRLLTVWVVIIFIISCDSSTESISQHFDSLPSDLALQEDTPQKYSLSVDYYTNDIYGKLISRMNITAEYTRALPEGKVRWNNVRIAKAQTPEEPFSESELQEYMENFTYIPSGEMLDDSFFKDFPPGIMETRVLIWDMMSIEVWAWNYFDKLKLNEEYKPTPEGETFEMTENVFFHNKDLSLTWIGLSKMNNELSALIHYESLLLFCHSFSIPEFKNSYLFINSIYFFKKTVETILNITFIQSE